MARVNHGMVQEIGGRCPDQKIVRMTPNLKEHIARLPEHQWKEYRKEYREDSETVLECADVLNYWPEDEDRPEDA